MYIQEVDEHMTLRMLTIRNAKQLFQIIDSSRAYLDEWLPWLNEAKTLTDVETSIKESFQTYANKQELRAGIFVDHTLVGIISFNEFDWRNNIGYIGYWLAKHHQGKGIMTKAVAAFIDYGFTELALNRIDIRTAFDNKKSQAIPERLNFKQEGHLRQAEWLYDHYVDHIVYGMLKNEWNSN